MLSRTDKSAIADWWWTIDRWILASALLLMGAGILFSFAASPSVAIRVGMADPMHFVKSHIEYTIIAVPVMLGVSFLSPRNIRILCFLLLAAALILLAMTLLFGVETKGSRRWISLLGFSIQPSEFMKPAYVVVMAWLFNLQAQTKRWSFWLLPAALLAVCGALLIAEPDIGQTLLITLTACGLYFIAGIHWFVMVILCILLLLFGAAAYLLFPHVHERVETFWHGDSSGHNFQVAVGKEAIIHGGWLGQGPGEGTVKRHIPDSHTDFVFSVVAEEYGIILAMAVVGIFAFIVLRSFYIAMKERDIFTRYAISGLAFLFGLQSMINLAVNLNLMPPKGMTLPFISYGGSSLIAIAFTMGCLLSLTRKRPETRAALNFD